MRKETRTHWLLGWCPQLVVVGCFIFGGLCGCLLGAYSSPQSTQELGMYLTDYTEFVRQGLVEWSVPRIFWSQLRWPAVCLILGVTGLGLFVLPLVIWLRGLITVFGISCFLRCFGWSGVLPALLLFGVPSLFWAPFFFLVCIMSLRGSFQRLRSRSGRGLLPSISKSTVKACVSAGVFLLALCVIYEAFLLPELLSAAVGVLT